MVGEALVASWGDDNTIVFATNDPGTGLWRLSPDGVPEVLTRPDPALQNDHVFPSRCRATEACCSQLRRQARRTAGRWPFLT